jgi:signal transduction histidine kinase
MRILLCIALGALCCANAQARNGTPEEAKAMLDAAVAHYAEAGRTQALADFNAKKAPFGADDLYVFCIDHAGNTSANGGFPSYVGTHIDTLKDADGKPLGQRLVDAAKSDGDVPVDYAWLNPVTKQRARKVSYVRKLSEDVCGVGAYLSH